MPQVDADRIVEALACCTNAMDRLSESLVVSADAMKVLAESASPLPERVSTLDPPPEADPESLSAMTERVQTLFATPGINGIYPPALIGLLRAGGQEATVNEAVYQLTTSEWLVLRDDGMLHRLT